MITYIALNMHTFKAYCGKTTRCLSHAKAHHNQRAKGGVETHFYRAIRKYGGASLAVVAKVLNTKYGAVKWWKKSL